MMSCVDMLQDIEMQVHNIKFLHARVRVHVHVRVRVRVRVRASEHITHDGTLCCCLMSCHHLREHGCE